MAIALGAGLVASRKAEKAAWTAKSSSFTDFGGEATPADVGHRDVTRFDRPCPCAPKMTDFFGPDSCPAHETTYTENRHVFSLTGRALSFYMFSSLSSAGFSGT